MNYPPVTDAGPIPSVKIGKRRDVTLPAEILRTLRLRRGMKLDIHVSGNTMVLTRAETTARGGFSPADARWKQMEREADQAIARGDVLGPFDTASEAIEALRRSEV